MRCTSSSRRRRSKQRRRKQIIIRVSLFILIVTLGSLITLGIAKFLGNQTKVADYETKKYNAHLYQAELFSGDICVVNENVSYDKFNTEDTLKAAALFNLSDHSVLMAENMHEVIYPASTTKLMTFYLAMKYGDLEETVTVSETAIILPSGSSRAWLKANDRMSLKDLL